MSKLRIRGYCDRPSVAPGETLGFYVSSDDPGEYAAALVRVVNGDLNPGGPGPRETVVDNAVNRSYPARNQRTQMGGYVEVPDLRGALAGSGSLSIHAFISSMLPTRGRQGLVSRWDSSANSGWALMIDEDGALAFITGDGTGRTSIVRSDRPLFPDTFYSVTAVVDARQGTLQLFQRAVVSRTNSRFGKVFPLDSDTTVSVADIVLPAAPAVPVIIGGLAEAAGGDRTWVINNFNGKIDAPSVYNIALDAAAAGRLAEGDRIGSANTLARWDFGSEIGSDGVPSDLIRDVSGNGHHGHCVNQPDLAMTGWNWAGIAEHFVHAPEQYGAIWFHEDSLDDSRWAEDFELTVPDDLASGCYAIRLTQGENEDWIPFFVRPPRGTATAKILLLMPTVSYLAYANTQVMQNAPSAQAIMGHVAVLEETDLELNERPWIYGLSTYDYHIDGRGCQYTSWRRPILNMRPRYRHEFGSVWQFPADLQLVDWLTSEGFEFDIATDHDLMDEGVELLRRYNVVVTGSHPEYYTREMIESWEDYLAEGGRGMYLAGNGMYWIASQHPKKPWVMEIRKGESGDQAWRARPGELYHSTSGERGGLWRMRGRASAKVWGVVYTSHGLDVSCGFVQMPDAKDPRLAWMVEGIGEGEVIGDFGLVGNGAAGLEVDRYDQLLGTPPNTMIVASSYGHTPNWGLVPEEQYFVHSGMNGPEHPSVRGDIVYFSTGKGGAMFSSSSMSWCASLSWNEYENNVSKLTGNVLRRFSTDGPIEEI
jgi:N,N-dimethylformamidase